eukprot:CAMPEP_0116866404 /NCGR_PEP_ID=MMETSP0418-20121206/26002_1 /TAXON_ID=1158023 /ORGANISM="Astrosyne radiata, Strain 13vi08-1A" /LENGTH=167 /DNA_ID=CAMNT_0004502019 /DNA_START=220 /DNA_END=723 /DNA_ORIENTATION=-
MEELIAEEEKAENAEEEDKTPEVKESPQPKRPVEKSGAYEIFNSTEYSAKVLNVTERPVFAYFTAPWCGPCRLALPTVKKVVKEFADRDVEFVEVSTTQNPDVAESVGVHVIPIVLFYWKGIVKETVIGMVPQKVLANRMNRFLLKLGDPGFEELAPTKEKLGLTDL